MPALVGPALPAGTLRTIEQPRVTVDDELALRPWHPDDAAMLMAAFTQPDIQRWHMRRMDSEDEAREWVSGWARRWDRESDAGWAIARADDDNAVGYAALRTLLLFAAQAQVSYWVTPAARGKGIAARATRALARWAFDTLRLHRLSLVHSTMNRASCRVAVAAGFRLEGNLRDYMLHADGWHDVHMHALLRTDIAG